MQNDHTLADGLKSAAPPLPPFRREPQPCRHAVLHGQPCLTENLQEVIDGVSPAHDRRPGYHTSHTAGLKIAPHMRVGIMKEADREVKTSDVCGQTRGDRQPGTKEPCELRPVEISDGTCQPAFRYEPSQFRPRDQLDVRRRPAKPQSLQRWQADNEVAYRATPEHQYPAYVVFREQCHRHSPALGALKDSGFTYVGNARGHTDAPRSTGIIIGYDRAVEHICANWLSVSGRSRSTTTFHEELHIYHMQIMEGDIIRAICDNVQRIGHFHTAGVPGRRDIDEHQELNYGAVCQAIADTNYGLLDDTNGRSPL
jgi:hypothetical protein